MIAADEPTVMVKPLLDPIVVKNGQATEVLPIPPAPMKAVGIRLSASSSRPKKVLGGGGGDSPGMPDSGVRWQAHR